MLKFTEQAPRKGSSQIVVNVDRNGVPFGQLWTFRNSRTTFHPWHAKPLNGEHRAFWDATGTKGDFEAAKAYLESVA